MTEEARICNKCGVEKAIGSFARRYGRSTHLRENTCGMCKKRAHIARDPDKARADKDAENVRRRARDGYVH